MVCKLYLNQDINIIITCLMFRAWFRVIIITICAGQVVVDKSKKHISTKTYVWSCQTLGCDATTTIQQPTRYCYAFWLQQIANVGPNLFYNTISNMAFLFTELCLVMYILCCLIKLVPLIEKLRWSCTPRLFTSFFLLLQQRKKIHIMKRKYKNALV